MTSDGIWFKNRILADLSCRALDLSICFRQIPLFCRDKQEHSTGLGSIVTPILSIFNKTICICFRDLPRAFNKSFWILHTMFCIDLDYIGLIDAHELVFPWAKPPKSRCIGKIGATAPAAMTATALPTSEDQEVSIRSNNQVAMVRLS